MRKGVRKRRDSIWTGKLPLAPAPISSSESRAYAVTLLCYLVQGFSLKARDLWNICRVPWDHEEVPPNYYSHHCFADCKVNIYSLKKALKILKVKNIFRLSIIPLHRDINN